MSGPGIERDTGATSAARAANGDTTMHATDDSGAVAQ